MICLLLKIRLLLRGLKRLFNIYYNKLYMTGKMDAGRELRPRLKQTGLLDDVVVNLKAVEFDEKWLDKIFIDKQIKSMGELGVLTVDDKKFLKGLSDRSFLDAGELENKITQIKSNLCNRSCFYLDAENLCHQV